MYLNRQLLIRYIGDRINHPSLDILIEGQTTSALKMNWESNAIRSMRQLAQMIPEMLKSELYSQGRKFHGANNMKNCCSFSSAY